MPEWVCSEHGIASADACVSRIARPQLRLPLCDVAYFDEKRKECQVEIVGLVQTVVQFFQCHLCGFAFVVVVRIDELYYFQAD